MIRKKRGRKLKEKNQNIKLVFEHLDKNILFTVLQLERHSQYTCIGVLCRIVSQSQFTMYHCAYFCSFRALVEVSFHLDIPITRL